MATDVRTTIEIKGKDSASGALNKVRDALKSTGDAGAKAAVSTDAIGERAGDMERGFMGLKDIIGGVAEGPLAAFADRMGGIESVVKGFGPGMGAVGLAIGAAAMGASLLYEQIEKARKAGIQNQIDELSKAQADKELLAARYGLTREMLGLAEKAVGLKGVQLQIDKEATQIAALEAEILKKQMDGETEGIARREVAIRAGRERVSQLMLQVEKEKELVASDEKRKATAMFIADNSGNMLERERATALILDRKDRLNARAKLLGDQRAIIEEKIKVAQAAQDNILTRSVKGMEELLGLKTKLHEIEVSTQGIASEGEAIAAERRAKAEAAGQRARERQKVADEARRKAADDYYAAETQLGEKLIADAQARANNVIELQDRVRQGGITAAESPAERAKLANNDIKIRQLREMAEIERTLAGDEERYALRKVEIEQKFAAERARVTDDLVKAKDTEAKAAKDASSQQASDAFALAGAVGESIKMMDGSKRTAAVTDMILATAQAAYQFAIGNIPGGISAGVAAINFGKVAIGGGGEGASAPNAAGTGMGAAATSSQAGTAGGGTGGATNIYFTKGFYGDAHSTAKSIAGTLKKAPSTGYGAWKGA